VPAFVLARLVRSRNYDPLWRIKAREDGRLRTSPPTMKRSATAMATRTAAVDAWREIERALAASGEKSDRDLAKSVSRYVEEMPVLAEAGRMKEPETSPEKIRPLEQKTGESIHER
jgi:hypothetical protein